MAMQNGYIVGNLTSEPSLYSNVLWKIPHFLDLPAYADYHAQSPEFLFANATWCLQLYPNGVESLNNDGCMDLWLVRLHSHASKHHVHFRFGIKTRRGKDYCSYIDNAIFDSSNDLYAVTCRQTRNRIASDWEGIALNDIVTVFCDIRVKEDELEALPLTKQREDYYKTKQGVVTSKAEQLVEFSKKQDQEASSSVNRLQLNYKELLQSEEYSDVTLVVKEKEFRAHRAILSVRSTVFASMFKHEMSEKLTGVVVIDDTDPDTFPDFLQYLYTGRVEALSPVNVFNLFSSADKYDIQDLRKECLEYMKATLSVETFSDVLVLSLRHGEKELLKLATDFFSENLTDIIVTVKWQVFMRENSTEANELFIKALVTEKK